MEIVRVDITKSSKKAVFFDKSGLAPRMLGFFHSFKDIWVPWGLLE